jgi:hypothetical protein
MDKLDFLDGVSPIEEALPVEATPEPVAEAIAPEPVTSEPTPTPVAAPVAPTPPEPGHVPIGALMDERDRRKAAEERVAQFERQQQPTRIPDPLTDPEGALNHTAAAFQSQLIDTKLNLSEVAARRFYGAEAVDAAKDWALQKFSQSPAYQNEVLSQPDPYDFAVQQYKKDQISSSVTEDDYKAFQSWKSAQAILAGTSPAASAAPQITATSPPRSIASEPSGGGVTHVPLDDAAGYNALFE